MTAVRSFARQAGAERAAGFVAAGAAVNRPQGEGGGRERWRPLVRRGAKKERNPFPDSVLAALGHKEHHEMCPGQASH